jgi:hypothetical protein
MQQLFDAVGGGGGGGALVTSGAVAVAPAGGAIIGADGGALLVQQISLLSRPVPVQIITSIKHLIHFIAALHIYIYIGSRILFLNFLKDL